MKKSIPNAKVSLKRLEPTPRDIEAEEQRIHEKTIVSMTTPKILHYVYKRHNTGVWICVSVALAAALVAEVLL